MNDRLLPAGESWMPTINQLVRVGRDKTRWKTSAPAASAALMPAIAAPAVERDG